MLEAEKSGLEGQPDCWMNLEHICIKNETAINEPLLFVANIDSKTSMFCHNMFPPKLYIFIVANADILSPIAKHIHFGANFFL